MATKKSTTKAVNFYDWNLEFGTKKTISFKGFVALTLNTYNIKGYTSLHNLALISSADVYEEGKNDTGVQRPDTKSHAKKAIEYALGEGETFEEASKFYWGDVLLCNRNSNATKFKIGQNTFTELTQQDLKNHLGEEVTISVTLSKLNLESIKEQMRPDISRIDGNHRLKGYQYKFEDFKKEGQDTSKLEKLQTPYTFIPGLTINEEDYIFEMVNGTPKKVDTSQVKEKRARRLGVGLLEGELDDLCLFIATELQNKGNAFEGLVSKGGKSDTAQKKLGRAQPLKLAPLSNYIKQQLKTGKDYVDLYADDPSAISKPVVAYWNDVKKVFPNMFEDKAGKDGEFVLFQAIGMYGFGMLGGNFLNSMIDEDKIDKNFFFKRLKILKNNVDMKRTNDNYRNLAGFGGGKEVYLYFLKNVSDQDVRRSQIKDIF